MVGQINNKNMTLKYVEVGRDMSGNCYYKVYQYNRETEDYTDLVDEFVLLIGMGNDSLGRVLAEGKRRCS